MPVSCVQPKVNVSKHNVEWIRKVTAAKIKQMFIVDEVFMGCSIRQLVMSTDMTLNAYVAATMESVGQSN